jgi:hypothetical protein
MKIRCDCGHVISDSTDSLPYKCDLLPDDGYWDNIHQPILDSVLDYARCVAAGDREGWLSRNFAENYPRDSKDESILSDLISAVMSRVPTAYQCTECGNILIPKRDGSGYLGFQPLDDDWRDALSWRK